MNTVEQSTTCVHCLVKKTHSDFAPNNITLMTELLQSSTDFAVLVVAIAKEMQNGYEDDHDHKMKTKQPLALCIRFDGTRRVCCGSPLITQYWMTAIPEDCAYRNKNHLYFGTDDKLHLSTTSPGMTLQSEKLKELKEKYFLVQEKKGSYYHDIDYTFLIPIGWFDILINTFGQPKREENTTKKIKQ
jgi:hypothetical protein